LAIVNDILDLAKIEAGKMTVDSLAFAPADLFRRMRALFAPRAHAAGLMFGLDISPECSQQRLGDAHRIQQILNNLVGNALKFTAAGGITVSGEIAHADKGDILVFRVTDTGIGMSKEQSEKVFGEFEQAEGSTARRYGGTGLGLSITRHLVSLMGGTIALESKLGKGTEVTIRVPMADAPPSVIEPAPIIAPNPETLKGLRVLVADDNRTNRRILGGLLEKMAVQVTMAKDGHEAHQLYHPGQFDMLLLDISMPGLDGIGALQAIRECEALENAPPTPALAVTANAMQHQIDEYLAAGFAGHVAKPFRKAELLETIAANRTADARSPLFKPDRAS